MEIQPVLTPFEYVIKSIQTLGWPAVCVFLFLAGRKVDKFVERWSKIEDGVEKMTTNCFPTMEKHLADAVRLLEKQDQRWESYLLMRAAQKGDE